MDTEWWRGGDGNGGAGAVTGKGMRTKNAFKKNNVSMLAFCVCSPTSERTNERTNQ